MQDLPPVRIAGSGEVDLALRHRRNDTKLSLRKIKLFVRAAALKRGRHRTGTLRNRRKCCYPAERCDFSRKQRDSGRIAQEQNPLAARLVRSAERERPLVLVRRQ